MSAIYQSGKAGLGDWVSAKTLRLAALLGTVTLVSIAVNTLIIIAANHR